jgi:recombination protein U
MKQGKRVENNVKLSAEKQKLFCYRLRDNAASFYQTNQLRFTSSNMCDYIIFNGEQLLCLEVKSHKGVSLPLSAIRENQLEQLLEASKYKNIISGFLVHFEDIEKAYFINVEYVDMFVKSETRKSMPLNYFESVGIEIDLEKKKVNFIYDINKIFLTN